MRGPAIGPPPTRWGSRAEMMLERRRAVALLERDAQLDWRRPLVGALALVLLLGGQLVAAAVLTVEASGGERALVLAGSAAAVVVGAGLGWWAWRSGRRVVSALVAWEELPDHVPVDDSIVPFEDREPEDADTDDERRHLYERNLVMFRTRQLRPALLPRVVAGTVLTLSGLGIVVGVVGELVGERTLREETAALVLPGVSLLLAGLVVLGGLQRLGTALFRRDRRMRRRRREREEAHADRAEQWRRQWED